MFLEQRILGRLENIGRHWGSHRNVEALRPQLSAIFCERHTTPLLNARSDERNGCNASENLLSRMVFSIPRSNKFAGFGG